ncbi:MAG: YidH family protein [Tumebacillaceae bacterium]
MRTGPFKNRKEPESESKFIQQHLANERTFLAWIRTTVSIMGVGLVTTSLHFELSTNFNTEADRLIKVVGYSTLLLGVIMLVFSMISYLQKRKGINDGTFRSTSTFVLFICAFMALIVFLFGMYLFKSY